MLWFLQTLVVKDEVCLFVYENDKLSLLYAQFKKYAVTRLCAGFSDRMFLYELEVERGRERGRERERDRK